jgi:type II secretory pathway pseudopilin PulG
MMTGTNRGVTLIELLSAMALVIIAMTSILWLFPNASKAVAANRQRITATQLAQSLLQQITRQPYDLIDPTQASTTNFPNNSASGINIGDCDCSQAAFLNLPNVPPSVMVNGTSFTESSCVNYVDPAAPANTYCPSGIQDPSLKSIRVRVFWSQGGNGTSINATGQSSSYVDATSEVTRS